MSRNDLAACAPRWLVALAVAAAVALALPLAELAGADPGPLTIVGTTALHLWLLAAASELGRLEPERLGDFVPARSAAFADPRGYTSVHPGPGGLVLDL